MAAPELGDQPKIEQVKIERKKLISPGLLRKTGYLLGGIIVIALLVVGWGIYQQARINCSEVSKQADDLIKKGKYQAAYDKLKASTKKCDRLTGKSPAQQKKASDAEVVQSISIKKNLAMAAYQSGDKKAAQGYAQQAIEANINISPDERSKIPNQDEFIQSMYQIKYGTYEKIVKDGRQ